MIKIRNAIAAMALVAPTMLTGAVDAYATPTGSAAPEATGFLFVYYGTYQDNVCGQFDQNQSVWGPCTNKAESLFNDGYPGNRDDAKVYWGSNYTGAWRYLYNGAILNDLHDFTFDPSNGASGHGQQLWHNIASSSWVNL
jgi:hypothetical protein